MVDLGCKDTDWVVGGDRDFSEANLLGIFLLGLGSLGWPLGSQIVSSCQDTD